MSAEKGYPHWHSDVRTDDMPREAGLMFACKIKTDTGEGNNISLKNEVEIFFPLFFPRFPWQKGGGGGEVSGQFRTICLSCISINYLLSLSIGPREGGPSEGGSS